VGRPRRDFQLRRRRPRLRHSDRKFRVSEREKRKEKCERRRGSSSSDALAVYILLRGPDVAPSPIGTGLGALHRIKTRHPQRGGAKPGRATTRKPASAAQIEILPK
jgi:hypothetical protein